VKNLFGLFRLLISASRVYYESYRQVLTPVNNLQCLLRLPIFNKTRLVSFYKNVRQRNYTTTGFYQSEKVRVLRTLIHRASLGRQSFLSACRKLMMLASMCLCHCVITLLTNVRQDCELELRQKNVVFLIRISA
jgi:hypothetical protein